MSNRRATEQRETRAVTIRFPQTDPAGIVFYPRYFEMVLRLFPGVPFTDLPVAFKTQFLKPNRLGDRLSIEFRHDPESSDWSVTGRTRDGDCFSIQGLPTSPDLASDAHGPEQPAFRTRPEPAGDWALDKNGRLHLSRYFELLNMAIEEWIEATLEMPFHEMHVGRKVGIPTVQFNTCVRTMPTAGDSLSVWIRPTKLGGRAMTFVSWLVSGDRCLVRNEQVVVFVRMLEQGYESIPIPGEIGDKFRAQLVDDGRS